MMCLAKVAVCSIKKNCCLVTALLLAGDDVADNRLGLRNFLLCLLRLAFFTIISLVALGNDSEWGDLNFARKQCILNKQNNKQRYN